METGNVGYLCTAPGHRARPAPRGTGPTANGGKWAFCPAGERGGHQWSAVDGASFDELTRAATSAARATEAAKLLGGLRGGTHPPPEPEHDERAEDPRGPELQAVPGHEVQDAAADERADDTEDDRAQPAHRVGPGMSQRAIAPAMRPMKIEPRMPI